MTSKALQIVVRADASSAIGTGHVTRCLTLARALREEGAVVRFVSREHEGNLCDLVEAAGFDVVRLGRPAAGSAAGPDGPAHADWLGTSQEEDAGETELAIGEQGADWIVVDHYAIDERWQRLLRKMDRKIMVIDDLADRQHDCDLLLDQNFFANGKNRYLGKVPERASLLLGPAYALLAPDYQQLRRRVTPRRGLPGRVLVSFGGADHQGLTRRAVDALLTLGDGPIAADVILSRASADFDILKKVLAGHQGIRLHDRVASLAPYMVAADLAVGAGGSTHWERMCLGLPTLVITMAENQKQIAGELAGRNLIHWLGDAEEVTADQIRDAISTIRREGFDPDWSSRCMDLVDGQGALRVAAVMAAELDMALLVRHADLGDEDLLLQWANDPVTRANGFNPDAIERQDHVRWFRTRLRDPIGCRFFIVETTSGVPVGQVRFDDRGGEWEISYAVAPAFRGRGLGRLVMDAGLRALGTDAGTVCGQVKPENTPSRRIFEALGFVLRSSDPARLVFERHSHN